MTKPTPNAGEPEIVRHNVTRFGEMHNEPDGKWVRFDDYTSLRTALADSRECTQNWIKKHTELMLQTSKAINEALEHINTVESALAERTRERDEAIHDKFTWAESSSNYSALAIQTQAERDRLRQQLLRANYTAQKGEATRLTAGGMEQKIAELRQQLAKTSAHKDLVIDEYRERERKLSLALNAAEQALAVEKQLRVTLAKQLEQGK